MLSTHSTVFLDQAAATAKGTWVVERSDGRSTVRNADTNFASVLRAVGVRLSDILSAERLVFVEGETDAEILQAWFPDLVLTRRTAIVPLGGGDRAYQIEMIENVLQAADELGRHVIFLRDADHLSPRNRDKMNDLDHVTLLPRREIENYLLDITAIQAVLSTRSGVEKVLDRGALEKLVNETADSLRPAVLLRSVADELMPIRIADRRTIRSIVHDGGGLSELKEAARASVSAGSTLIDGLDSIWQLTEHEINEAWSSNKLEVAPGSEILEAVWSAHGVTYNKRRDGPKIAAAMEQQPEDICKALADFLQD